MKLWIKTTLSILFSLLTTIGIAQDKFTITGNLPQAGFNKMVLLNYINTEGKSAKDSALVINGKFNINGTTAFGNKADLELKKVPGEASQTSAAADRKEFYLEKGNTKVFGTDRISTSSISGTKVQEEYIEYHSKMDPFEKEYEKIAARYVKAKNEKDSLELKNIANYEEHVMARGSQH